MMKNFLPFFGFLGFVLATQTNSKSGEDVSPIISLNDLLKSLL